MINDPNYLSASRICGAARLADIRKRLESRAVFTAAGLGDSLTYGWMVERGFFDRFVDKLKSRFPCCPIRPINAGVPGDTAKGGLSRLSGLLSAAPQIVTVQFGLNDMYQGVKADDFEATLGELVEKILQAAAHPVLVTSCPLDWEEGRILAEEFYGRIRETARKADVPCASLDVYWGQIVGPPNTWADRMHADHVHPKDRGHALMADGLYEAVMGVDKHGSSP